ncbi:c-type cytochrome [Ostreiculturibacter nitratireducens]|uniref:c-type cytochrome n=1 Tax=Ostreiculturibacter nitratireducens TaxID=3075226 RepID=UPI0031B56D89
MRALLSLAILAVLATPVAADEPGLGETTFFEHCGGCHGENADGDGPMTEILTVTVPDLTTLSARNEGTFPWLRVVHVVDGRTGLRAHGGPMPIFGAVFEGDKVAADAPDGTPVITSARVLAVVDYLETLQQP